MPAQGETVKEQLDTVFHRDGLDAALEYAEQTMKAYRRCAKPQANGKKHFAHVMPFRPHFVRSILYLRPILKKKALLKAQDEAFIMTLIAHTEK